MPPVALRSSAIGAADDKAGMTPGAATCFPGLETSASDRSLLPRGIALGSESNLVCASRGKAALLSCNEHKGRFLLLAKAQSKTAAASGEALVPRLCEMPPGLRQTLTLDNGSEMAQFKKLERATGLFTYFCRPHSPWHRGANENECSFQLCASRLPSYSISINEA